MISLEYQDKKIQAILRRELNLSGDAVFQTREILEGTQLFRHTLFTIADRDITYILIRGTFVATDVYILFKTDLPEEFQFPHIARDLESKGLDPVKTRIVCIAVNAGEKVPGAQMVPEIQIARIPF
ncbi:MAG TPA: hypothetical protein VLY83_00065 [Methanoregula sp.]|nr:hypothetical protein [Methanoregula sp.]